MFCEDFLGLVQDPALLTDDFDYSKFAADGCSLSEVLRHHIPDVACIGISGFCGYGGREAFPLSS